MTPQNMRAFLSEWARGVNPDRRQHPDEPDMDPQLFQRMLKGELSADEATRLNREQAPARRAFNDRIREQLGIQSRAGELPAEKVFTPEAAEAETRSQMQAADAELKAEIVATLGEERAARLFNSGQSPETTA